MKTMDIFTLAQHVIKKVQKELRCPLDYIVDGNQQAHFDFTNAEPQLLAIEFTPFENETDFIQVDSDGVYLWEGKKKTLLMSMDGFEDINRLTHKNYFKAVDDKHDHLLCLKRVLYFNEFPELYDRTHAIQMKFRQEKTST